MGAEGRLGDRARRIVGGRPPRASSLVVSVFGDAVVPHGGVVWLGSLIRWLALFGVNERAVRTAVQRLAADDWFAIRSHGRRSDYVLTPASRHRFADAERRIYSAAPPKWDGTWSVVVLGHGGMSPAKRDAARQELYWHGFGELAPSVLVHPRADLEELGLALADLGVAGRAVVLRARAEDRLPGTATPLRELVASAWDLSDFAAEYRSYLRRFAPLLAELRSGAALSPETCFRLRVLAIHEYRRTLLHDPELPAELLPAAWVGAEARRLCAAVYRRVEARAAEYVLTTGATASGRLAPAAPFYFRRFGGIERPRRRLTRPAAPGSEPPSRASGRSRRP